MSKNNILLTLSIFISFFPIYGHETIILTGKKGQIPLGLYLSCLEDKNNQWTIHDVRKSLFDKKWKKNKRKSLNLGYTESTFWIRFHIKNPSSKTVQRLLELSYPLLDSIDIYTSENKFKVIKAGDTLPFNIRQINNRKFLFLISLPANKTIKFYIRIKTEGAYRIPMSIWTIKEFNKNENDSQIIWGVYYGILIVMVLYNLFLFISLRDIVYFFYVVYIFCFILIQISYNGFGFAYFWQNHTHWQQIATPFFAALGQLCVLVFTVLFLKSKTETPKLYYFFIVLIWICGCSAILSVFLTKYLHVITNYLQFFSVSILLLAGIISLKNGYRPARFFLIAFIALLAGVFLNAARNLGIFPNNLLTQNGLQIGSAFEVILLSLALGDKINILRGEKEKAQRDMLENKEAMLTASSRFVPKQFISFLGRESIIDVKLGDSIQKEMSILFSDIRSFTTLSETMTPKENFEFINSYLKRMEPFIRNNGGFIDKYIGDAVMALFPEKVEDSINASIAMQRDIFEYNTERINKSRPPIRIGIGIHTGNLMLGTIGGEMRMDGTVISDAVNLASRMEGLTKLFGAFIVVSEDSLNRLEENHYRTRLLGTVQVKGKKEPVGLHEIIDADSEKLLEVKMKSKAVFEKGLSEYRNANFHEAKLSFNSVLNTNTEDLAAQLYLQRCDFYLKKGTPPEWNGVEILDNK